MKRLLLVLFAVAIYSTVSAQKFGYVDTDYILKKVPNYVTAQSQLEKLSKQYQQEVEDKYKVTEELFKKYQSEKVLLTDDMRQKREAEIVNKEKEVKELQKRYFSPDGLLEKKKEELLKPIQEKLYKAVEKVANDGGYPMITDVANNPGVIYSNPKYDLSDKVLQEMGLKN